MAASGDLKDSIKQLPDKPGIYKFFDDQDIIYVGKAINIRKRVSSYFAKSHRDAAWRICASLMTSGLR
ncbi:MAG: hypothetical protein EOP50_12810 [Sphingobacteriales bacterium]|nr:MAG: hypothetical protein EOP50_12810 [Sphingobacteriales bacterium]